MSVPNDFNNLNHVYRFYVEHCKIINISPVSNAVFTNKWNSDYNIGRYTCFEKGQMCICEGYKNKGTKIEEY